MAKIHIPTPLRQYTGKQATVDIGAANIGEALNRLRDGACPAAPWPWNGLKGEDVLRLQRKKGPLPAKGGV